MPQFIFSYRSAKDYDATTDPDGLAAWGAFINDVIASRVVDPGRPVFEPAVLLGDTGQSTQLGGYAIVTADDLQAAAAMAEHCPTITRGGGVEVAVLAPLPPNTPQSSSGPDKLDRSDGRPGPGSTVDLGVLHLVARRSCCVLEVMAPGSQQDPFAGFSSIIGS